MKINFLGHAAFLITSEKGVRIITDPYKPGCYDGGIKYDKITEQADIVTISHEHDDHNERAINGNPVIVNNSKPQQIKDINISGIDVFHDTIKGKERGPNIIFKMAVDSMNIVHLGDLGHDLSTDEIAAVGNVDIMMVPVGGHFTMEPDVVDNVIGALNPKIVIPMHFKTDKCGFPIAGVDEFIKDKEAKRMTGEITITKDDLPENTTIYVLTPTK